MAPETTFETHGYDVLLRSHIQNIGCRGGGASKYEKLNLSVQAMHILKSGLLDWRHLKSIITRGSMSTKRRDINIACYYANERKHIPIPQSEKANHPKSERQVNHEDKTRQNATNNSR